MALLVSRRNEGDHRQIHQEHRSTPNITAQLLGARVRKEQVEPLTEHSSFVQFGEAFWSKRGKQSIVNQLLEHQVEGWRLPDLTFAEKSRRTYGTTVQAQFRETGNISTDLVAFASSIPRARPQLFTPV